MLSINKILESAKTLVEGRFPGEPVYTNQTPTDFVRPSWLVGLGKSTMEDASMGCVEMTVPVVITSFVTVDEYYNNHFEELLRRMHSAMELFAAGYLELEGRALHVVKVTGECQYDYAEVAVTLRYQDSRPVSEEEYPLMGHIQTRHVSPDDIR